MENKSILTLLLVPTLILLVAAVAMQFIPGMAWGPSDFALVWILMAGVGLAYKLATSRTANSAYRAGAGIAVGTAFVLLLGNLAVGFIGSEDHPANLMYLGVLLIGIIGAALARFEPQGMARTLLAMALAQFVVPLIALSIWRPEFSPGVLKVLGLNTVFALLFAASALLFQRAAHDPEGRRDQAMA